MKYSLIGSPDQELIPNKSRNTLTNTRMAKLSEGQVMPQMKQTSYIPTPGSAYMTMQNDYSQSTIAMDDSQAKLKNLRNSSDETR